MTTKNTTLTTTQQQRVEALNVGAQILTEQSSASIFGQPSKGALSPVDIEEAITLARYVLHGDSRKDETDSPVRVFIGDEDLTDIVRDEITVQGQDQ